MWWFLTYCFARVAVGTSRIQWLLDYCKLTFTAIYQKPIAIDFTSFVQKMKGCCTRLECQLEALFDRGLWLQVQLLDVTSFTNNLFHQSPLFELEANIKQLQPLVRCLFSSLGCHSAKKKKSWLRKVQQFLTTLVQCLYGTSRVPPQVWQTLALTFAPYKCHLQNLFIEDGMCYIGHPPAKQAGHTDYLSFWALLS